MRDETVRYFRIKNWEKYQHRDHEKTMPWIKLYTHMLSDPEFMLLKEGSRLAWVLLLLYCGSAENKFPHSAAFLRARLGLKRLPDLALFESFGWIEEIPARSGRGEDAATPRLDKIREEQIRTADAASTASAEKGRNRRHHLRENEELGMLSIEGETTAVKAPPTLIEVPKKSKPSNEVERLVEVWNKSGLPPLKGFFAKRTEVLVRALAENSDLEYWEGIFSRVRQSPFLMSSDKKNKSWKITIEWVMQHHIEISEGKFNDEVSEKHRIAPIRT